MRYIHAARWVDYHVFSDLIGFLIIGVNFHLRVSSVLRDAFPGYLHA